MKKYRVWVCLETEDIVEANDPEEAFMILSDDAIAGGSWDYTVEEIEEE